MLVGITGQIGSGKSEVARIFANHGAFVISADKIGKDVVEKKPAILHELAKSFGNQIFTKSGRLQRKKLASIAFSSETNKKKLNKIVHPVLLKELSRQIRIATEIYSIVIVDAALLIDWGLQKKMDYTILVHASQNIRIARLGKLGYSSTEAMKRIKSQLMFSDLKKGSNIVIFNNKSLAALEVQVKKILQKLC
jgi:dephospho-CoA kinase